MLLVVPCVVNIDRVPSGRISISKHRVIRDMDEDRPAGVDFALEVLESEPSRQATRNLTLDVLREVRDHGIATGFREQA